MINEIFFNKWFFLRINESKIIRLSNDNVFNLNINKEKINIINSKLKLVNLISKKDFVIWISEINNDKNEEYLEWL